MELVTPITQITLFHKAWRTAELVLLFAGLPLAIVYELLPIGILPAFFLLFVYCTAVLLADRSFERRRFGQIRGIGRMLRSRLVIFIASAIVMTVAVYLLVPDQFLGFVRRAPRSWLMVMILYPLLSVFPQEIVYRAFFFHRYRALFPGRWAMLIANALAFGFMHVIFENIVAVALTSLGGFLFATNYHRSESLPAVAIEHALYGSLIWTVGIGRYFYHGAVG